MSLPELCTRCKLLKDPALIAYVKVRGRMHDRVRICHACLSVKKVSKDRAHRESPLEKRARETLLELGYHFRQEHKVGKFFYDFALPSLRLLVEVDGHRWHAHRAYRDKAKTRLAEEAGWTVVRLKSAGLETGLRAAVLTAAQVLLDHADCVSA